MSTVQTTLEEMAESLTGYDEIAIAQHFGDTATNLLENNPTIGIRALIFIDVKRRDELTVPQAKTRAMELTLKVVTTYFADEPEDEVNPDEPESAAGKDDSPGA